MALRSFFVFSLLLFFMKSAIAQQTSQPIKRALLIGISKYPDIDSAWLPIHGKEDVDRLKKALLTQGFKQEYIRILTEKNASKINIINALKRLADETVAGDMIFISLSGHGQQISDDNADEPDAWDETFIPYDCPQYTCTKLDYTGDKHLRDDELNECLTAIRQKAGSNGQVFVIIDACHSGSSTRAFDVKNSKVPLRGGVKPLILPNIKIVERTVPTDANRLAGETKKEPANAAPMVAFFASASGEDNAEVMDERNQYAGPLALALAEILPTVSDTISYQALFEKIQIYMHKKSLIQTPTPEGKLNYTIYGGKLLGQIAHFLVVNQPNPLHIHLQSGSLVSLFPKTVMDFYPADTWDIQGVTPIAKGVITKSDPSGALIALDREIPDEKMVGTWGFVKQIPYNQRELLEKLRNLSWQDALISYYPELVPYTIRNGNVQDFLSLPKNAMGQLVMKEGIRFKLRIQNTSPIPIYVAMLDIMQDSVKVIVPGEGQQEFAILPGEIWDSGEHGEDGMQWEIGPPYGVETFKIIASDRPLPAELKQVAIVRGTRAANAEQQVGGGHFEIVDIVVEVTKK
jgi:hypothetical protein